MPRFAFRFVRERVTGSIGMEAFFRPLGTQLMNQCVQGERVAKPLESHDLANAGRGRQAPVPDLLAGVRIAQMHFHGRHLIAHRLECIV